MVGELSLGKLVAPVAECTLRELHDVAFVDEGEALASVRYAILERRTDETFGTFL